MENRTKVKAQYITKEYELLKKKSDKLKSLFSISKTTIPKFWSLKGISFEVRDGETIGIIGLNGSGKSTLSNILSGIIPPTSGELEINGETSIISIGAGLKAALTGMENIQLKCLMMGMTTKEIKEISPGIIEFSELGDFINQPVKNYSSGMKSRLGFAIAVHQNPDILIIDEALAVGDDTFYQKCLGKMMEFKKQGKTIFFISHSMSQVELLCEKTMWMHYGDLRTFGPTKEVISDYRAFSNEFKVLDQTKQKNYKKLKIEEQKSFNLNDYQKRKIEELVKNNLSRSNLNYIKNSSDFLPIGEKMTIGTKILLIFFTILLVFLGFTSIRTSSLSSVVKEPFIQFNEKKSTQKKPSSIDSTLEESTSTAISDSVDTTSEVGSEPEPERYVVQIGDYLEGIADNYQVTVESIIEVNQLENTVIHVGQTLEILNGQ